MTDSGPTTVREALDVEIEPMLLLDTSGSMNYQVDANSRVRRKDLIHEALAGVVNVLAAEDSQAEHEAEGGGLMTVCFSDIVQEIEDINPQNINEKWSEIQWGGGTYIVPGWNALVKTYMDEFGSRTPSERPILLALIITDGEAADAQQFGQILSTASGGVYVAVALLGYGAEHDQTRASYRQIAEGNPHVKVVDFSGETDPQQITRALLQMIA